MQQKNLTRSYSNYVKLEDAVEKVLKRGLSLDLYRILTKVYGRRGEKAFRYLIERRIKKYKDFFIVVGSEEYVVDEDFCTCKDFQINLKFRKPCAHILAVEIAKRLGLFDEVDAYYVDYFEVSR